MALVDLTYLPIDPADAPEQFSFEMDGQLFQARIDYNEKGDFYSCRILDQDGNVLYCGKLTYGLPLVQAVLSAFATVTTKIVPLDVVDMASNRSGPSVLVNASTLNKNVRVYLVSGSEFA